MISFDELVIIRQERLGIRDAPKTLLCFDPGLTTGCCVFERTRPKYAVHLPTGALDMGVKCYTRMFDTHEPSEVVMEDYKVYPHYAKQHVGSSLLTPRLIGVIETICSQRGIPFHKQMAADPKQFVTDQKLKAWGFYAVGLKHARDAIRHGCYYIIFPPKTRTSDTIQRTRVSAGHHVG